MPEEKKPAARKPVSKTTANKTPLSSNVVEQKLNEMLSESSPASSASSSSKSSMTKEKKQFPWTLLGFILLLVAVILIILYQVSSDFKKNANDLIGNLTGGTKPTSSAPAVKTFELSLKVVYNKASADQQKLVDKYIQTLEFNLNNTKANVEMIDMNDSSGKDLLTKINAKFVPEFITDKTVLTHPQYSQFSTSMNQVGDFYVFKTEGLEYLSLPDATDGVNIGAPLDKAKLVVIEYLSFSCGYCAKAHPVVEKLAEKYKDQVAFVMKNFDRGGPDLLLAQGALCANDQKRLMEMSAAIYDNQPKIFEALDKMKENPRALEDLLRTIAKEAKVNSNTMFACINANKYSETVTRQTKEGYDFNVVGTPTFFFGTKYVGGYIDEAEMEKIIQEALAKS